jgi:site-specific DNA-methyltransferase (adenine-specific)
MKKLPDNCIDMVVTSPPYDAVRKYNGFTYDLHAAGEQIHRVLKDGAVAVMVIQDQTKNFGKSLTSFKTIIDWCDNIGFKLFETIIYRKNGTEGAWWKNRFRIDHEYIPIFLKGEKPIYFDKEHLKIPSKHGGKIMSGFASRKTDGTTQESVRKAINALKCRGTIWYYDENEFEPNLEKRLIEALKIVDDFQINTNGNFIDKKELTKALTKVKNNLLDSIDHMNDSGTIWNYLMAGDKNLIKRKHPAHFPDKIPLDFIPTFCPEGGIVLDPFIGSGTTAYIAKKLNRHFIGFDISEEYCSVSNERLSTIEPRLI